MQCLSVAAFVTRLVQHRKIQKYSSSPAACCFHVGESCSWAGCSQGEPHCTAASARAAWKTLIQKQQLHSYL